MTGKRIVVICLVLLVLAAVYVVTRPPKPVRAADLLAERSQVQCRHPGEVAKEVPVGQHEPVNTNDEINVDQTGLGILTFADFLRVEILRKSELRVKAAPDPDVSPIVKLYLALGTTLQELQKRAGERVDVTTETDWATIRAMATEYLISMDDDEETWVVVFDGEAEVEAQRQTVVVRAGQATWVEPGKAPQPPFDVEMEPVEDWVRGARQGEEVGPIESVIVTPTPAVGKVIVIEVPPSATPAAAESFSLSLGGWPFNEELVQEAVGFAIDWTMLQYEIGEVVLVDFLSGETLAGPTGPVYDPDQARALLEAGGYDGFGTMVLFDPDDALAAILAEWVAGYLYDVEIYPESVWVDPADARAKLASMIEAGESGMLIERQ
jgi:mannose-6-phosphate isomerase-like protein (cupin superfamily)